MLDQPGLEPSAARGEFGVAVLHRKGSVPAERVRTLSLAHDAMSRLWPWSDKSYPGMRRGFLSMLSQRRGWSAVRWWLRGRTAMPAWAADDIARVLEDRGRGDLALAAELRSHAAAQRLVVRHNRGFMRVVDD